MNDHHAHDDDEQLKNKSANINHAKRSLNAIKPTVKNFPEKIFKKKVTDSKDKSTSYDELHFGNYE